MSDSVPLIVMMPGADFMAFAAESGGLRVTCPGCGCCQVFRLVCGRVDYATFEHEDGCRVHARISAAIADYERRVVRKG